MRLTIYGAGAIGGSLGAHLVRAGEDVLFVDKNPEHVAEINASGLLIEGLWKEGGEFIIKGKAALPEELQEELKVVLLAVKSQDTEEAVRQFLPLLTQDSMVISLQNGLNEEKIAKLIGKERTIGAFINWGANYIAPGHIRLGGEGSFYIGELDGIISERIKKIQKVLSAFIPVRVTRNIQGYLWSKQVYGSLLFATALTNLPIYEVVASPGVPLILGGLVREAMQVPVALGISLKSFDEFNPFFFKQVRDEEAMKRIAARFQGKIINKTGVWRDIAVRKRRTEVDGIVAITVRKGEELGLSLPLNGRLIDLIHEVEEGRRAMDIGNLNLLSADHD